MAKRSFPRDANLHYLSTDGVIKIRETVANIVDCSIEEIRVHGYLRSTSFFIVLAIKEIYIGRLLAMTQHDKDKLRKLKIDYIRDGFKTIKMQQTTGDKVFFQLKKRNRKTHSCMHVTVFLSALIRSFD